MRCWPLLRQAHLHLGLDPVHHPRLLDIGEASNDPAVAAGLLIEGGNEMEDDKDRERAGGDGVQGIGLEGHGDEGVLASGG